MAPARPERSFRQQVHDMLRESVLDAAFERACHVDWEDVYINDIARSVGVSRQTIHNEFGTKQQLAEALFDREMNKFLDGIVEVSEAAESLESAVRNSLHWMFSTARTHELVRRLVTTARSGGSAALLASVVMDPKLILLPMRDTIAQVYHERWGGDLPRVERIVDLAVRITMTAILMPADRSEESITDDIVEMVMTLIHAKPRVEP